MVMKQHNQTNPNNHTYAHRARAWAPFTRPSETSHHLLSVLRNARNSDPSTTPAVFIGPSTRVATFFRALPPQCSESLLLCVRVDIGTEHEGNGIEEWHPSFLRQKLLGKSQSKWGSDPANFHDWQETNSDCGPNLMKCPCTCNDGHRDKVDAVLNG